VRLREARADKVVDARVAPRKVLRRELDDEKAEPLPETIALFQELTASPAPQ